MCEKNPIFGPILVFSIYRGGGTPQTPSNIKTFVPQGVRKNTYKFQKRPGKIIWATVSQRLLKRGTGSGGDFGASGQSLGARPGGRGKEATLVDFDHFF